jgi:hypothetical protein
VTGLLVSRTFANIYSCGDHKCYFSMLMPYCETVYKTVILSSSASVQNIKIL